MKIRLTAYLATVLFTLTSVAFGAASGIVASEKLVALRQSGPKDLLITYRCPPATRAAFRDWMVKSGVGRFEAWKKQGVFKDYRILFNWFVESDTFDMLVVLSFETYPQITRWTDIEEALPGGLPPEALALGVPVTNFPMDLTWKNGADEKRTDAGRSVFLTIPYVYYPMSSLDDYAKYVEGYVTPQFNGWLKDGIIRSYHIYVNRFQTSRQWQALFLIEYENVEAFGQREKEVDKVKTELLADPAWKGLGDHKLAVRVEKETATSFELSPK
jgi:hypothetical protein